MRNRTMPTFRQTLERERDQLRSMRVAIRRRLEWFARGHQIGDQIDTRRTVEGLQRQLAAPIRIGTRSTRSWGATSGHRRSG
jgi:hypothetical protein